MVEGYHCAPITKHIGLESAKKQVEINQARVAAATRDQAMIDYSISIPYHKKMVAKYTELAFHVKDDKKKAFYPHIKFL